MYDAFVKEVLNPETTPEGLDEFLSLLLGQKVRVVQALLNDNMRITDESSLLVTDIVVRLEDGSLANLEIQKIGYLFLGQRSACYGADLLLRQYKAVRSRKRETFRCKDVGKIYCIVLYEKSPEEFHKFPEDYIHLFCMRCAGIWRILWEFFQRN